MEKDSQLDTFLSDMSFLCTLCSSALVPWNRLFQKPKSSATEDEWVMVEMFLGEQVWFLLAQWPNFWIATWEATSVFPCSTNYVHGVKWQFSFILTQTVKFDWFWRFVIESVSPGHLHVSYVTKLSIGEICHCLIHLCSYKLIKRIVQITEICARNYSSHYNS